MAVKLIRRLLNVNEYHSMAEAGILAFDEKVELIKGEIIRMSPIGSKHAYIVDRLSFELITRIARQAVVRIQNPIYLDQFSEPEPDLLVAKGPLETYKNRIPTSSDIMLLIEVSDSTLAYDKEIKVKLYAEARIPLVWIVNLREEEVEVYEDVQEGIYASQGVFKPGEILEIPDLNFALPVFEIFGK